MGSHPLGRPTWMLCLEPSFFSTLFLWAKTPLPPPRLLDASVQDSELSDPQHHITLPPSRLVSYYLRTTPPPFYPSLLFFPTFFPPPVSSSLSFFVYLCLSIFLFFLGSSNFFFSPILDSLKTPYIHPHLGRGTRLINPFPR